MIALALALFGAATVFAVAFFSPRYGNKIKRWITHYGGKAFAWLRNMPRLVRTMSARSIKIVQKILHKSADKGKKSRRKAPF